MKSSVLARAIVTAVAVGLALVSAGAARADRKPTAQEWADSLRHVRVNGAELAVLDLGHGEPIVFVHGTSADYRTWLGEIEPLAHDYRVIAYSRRYHFPNTGGGDGKDYSMALHERDLVALIDSLKLGRVNLVGHASGANLAAQLAADHPDRVRSLVLAEPAFPELMKASSRAADYSAERQLAYERARQSLTNDFAELGFEAIADWEFGPDAMASIPKSVQPRLTANVNALKLQVLSPVQVAPFDCERIKGIRCPVLYVEGARSPWYAHAMADEFIKCRPSTQRATLKGLSHGMVWDDPKVFTKAVTDFLGRSTLAGE